MTLHHNFRRIAATATVALAVTLGAGAALAQPGPGMHGPGAGAGEEMIGHVIAQAKAQLNLNTQQQGLFDAAVTQSKASHTSLRALHQKAKDALATELLKPQPNLALLVPIADSVQSDSLKIRNDTRAAWLTLYAALSTEQKAVIHGLVAKKMARAEAFGEKMRQHFLEMHGGTGG